MKLRHPLIVAMMLLCLLAVRTLWAMPAAGTIIVAQAYVTYFNDEAGVPEVSLSNQAVISVAAVAALRLEQDQQQPVVPGQHVVMIHTLTNLGNGPDRFALQVAVDGSPALGGVAIYPSSNGVPIIGASPIQQTSLLSTGDTMELAVVANVPATVAEATQYHLLLTATSQLDTAVYAENRDQLTISRSAVRLEKTVNRVEIVAGETLDYTLTFQNIGDTLLPERFFLIYGERVQGLLVENVLPAYVKLDVTFVPEVAPVQGRVLVYLSQSGRWIDYDRWDQQSPVTRIGALIPSENLAAGHSGRLSYRVESDAGLSHGTRIVNKADLIGGAPVPLAKSNEVTTLVIGDKNQASATLMFVEPAQRATVPEFTSEFIPARFYYLQGDATKTQLDVYLQLEGGNFRASPELADDVTVNLRSPHGELLVRLQETGVNTGVFRSESPVRLKPGFNNSSRMECQSQHGPDYTAVAAGCQLDAQMNNKLLGSIIDPVTQKTLRSVATVHPQGTVFDTTTFANMPNVKVLFRTIFDKPVVGLEGDEGSIASQYTDEQGRFTYPPLPPGRYFVRVEAPEGYGFPSTLSPLELVGKTIRNASYGPNGLPGEEVQQRGGTNIRGSFLISTTGAIEPFDIPLDRQTTVVESGLIIEKEVGRDDVAPGELVSYTVTLKNNSAQDLSRVNMTDSLPFGFKFLSGSARIDGETVADPLGAPGPNVSFIRQGNPALAANSEMTLTYTLEVGAGAIDSDGINRVVATAQYGGSQLMVSNEAMAKVMVRMEGVLSDKAILFGKVYMDTQCNAPDINIQNSNDWPIGGVRLYVEDGTWVITDENGQYSLMGLNPGNHVIRVDPITMPDGLVLKPLDNRNAANGESRFVDLVNGEMHRADFAVSCPKENFDDIFAQIKARNESIQGDWLLDEAAQYDRTKPQETADSTGDLSNGVIRAPDAGELDGDDAAATEQQTSDAAQPMLTEGPKMPVAKEAITSVTRQQALDGTFLWPRGQFADGRFMAVVRAGVQPSLYINGEPVARDRLGEQLLNNREQTQLMAWYGVALKEGENLVELKAMDMFGNERILAEKTFHYAGTAVSLSLTPAEVMLPADDGRTLLPVTVQLLDSHGQPARGVYFVTLESSYGKWYGKDIQDKEPGHQIRIDNGEAQVSFRSGTETGVVTLKASTGELEAETDITQVTPSRPLMAVGLVELNSGTMPDLLSATGSDTRGRVATFIKGDIAKDTRLTLSYDSDKDDDTELFRDVDPDAYYPITGDASEQGYEAQSRSKLYAKIERGLSSIMWGDYQSDSQGSEHDLARVQRTLTGVNAIGDNGETRVQIFAARPENVQRTEMLEPNGTAMNYRLTGAPIVRHSEIVVLEVWSRDNPGLMLDSTTLTRGADYTLDEFSGYLKFSNPVHSQDEEGNTQRIRVSYDLDGDGDAYTVAGARVEQQLNDSVVVGASYTHDGHESEGSDIGGAWIEYSPTDKTTIAVSAAQMTGKSIDSDNGDRVVEKSGRATRVQVQHQWENGSDTELTWARADKDFTNSSGGVSAGREETRLQHTQKLTDSLDVRAEAEVTRSEDDSNSQGDSVGAYLDHSFGDGWQVSAGSRYIRQRSEDDQSRYMTGQVGVGKDFTLLGKEASISAEYEHAFSNSRWRTALEGDWQVHDKVAVYGRFERDNELSPMSSDADRNEFSFGLKSDWIPNVQTYSEYRMRGATDGDQLEWVNGADTSLELMEGLTISPSVEWINTLSGDNSNDGLALSLGVDDKRHKNQRATGRVEYRNGQSQDYYGLDVAVARRLDVDWSGLIREEFRLEQSNEDGSQRLEHVMTAGLARRPKRDNAQHGLYLYQWKEERDDDEDLEDRTVHLISTHQNRLIQPGLTLSGRLGSKWVTTELGGDAYDSQTSVFDTRLTWDLNRRWDLDLRGGLLSVNGSDSVQWSAGVGVNYLVAENLRVGAHYNFEGFSDEDLDSQKYNAEGIHFSMQFKFDESLFDWFKS